MGEHEEKQPAEVLGTKRLEVVDDRGMVRAALGTNKEGVTGVFSEVRSNSVPRNSTRA